MLYNILIFGGFDTGWSSAFGSQFSISYRTDVDTARESLPGIDAVVFTGGADVDPRLYGEEPRIGASFNEERDYRDKQIFEAAKALDIPMIGVCRGGQFLNVMNGGKLWQHVDGHTASHQVIIDDLDFTRFETMPVTSTHHQMMRPTEKGEVLVYSKGHSREYHTHDSTIKDPNMVEPEVVLYDNTKCLCVQYHPEYMKTTDPAVIYFREKVLSLLEEDN